MTEPNEICAKCGFTYDGHIGNTGCLYPCWTPSGRFKPAAPSSVPSREAEPGSNAPPVTELETLRSEVAALRSSLQEARADSERLQPGDKALLQRARYVLNQSGTQVWLARNDYQRILELAVRAAPLVEREESRR